MLSIKAVGDIWLQTKGEGNPFVNVSSSLAEADLLFGNLETVLSTTGIKRQKAHVLATTPNDVKHLVNEKFLIVNIANNHIFDLGEEGFLNTITVLKGHNIAYVGGSLESDDKYCIINKKGHTIGFLGYTIGRNNVPKHIYLNRYDKNAILSDIKALHEKCDYVFVSLHWGTEYAEYPSPSQINDAHAFIDAGATVILGHHPHVLQGIEEYHGGVIAYSLGNFQFFTNSQYSRMKYCMIFSIDIDNSGELHYRIEPCVIDDKYIPKLLEGEDRIKELYHFHELSLPLAKNAITNRWWYEQIAETYLSDSMASFKKQIKEHGIKPLCIMLVWMFMPFNVRCYIGLLRKKISGGEK